MRGENQLKSDRVGAERINRYGTTMKIVEYNSANDMLVRFDDGYTTKAVWHCFDKGMLVSPYDKTLYGVGCLGEGKYTSRDKERGGLSLAYTKWGSMLQRCYDEATWVRQPTYKECTVAQEWHNYQNFAKWHSDNFYVVSGERMCLDKDILVKGNKMYSPDTCVYVPLRINTMFTGSKRTKHLSGLPKGVRPHKQSGTYRTADVGKVTSKTFKTPQKAFEFYKFHREAYIKQVAEEYKNIIPDRLYQALVQYEVGMYE